MSAFPTRRVFAFLVASTLGLGAFAVGCGQSKTDCRRLCWCKSHGICAESGGKCVANSDADCRKSDVCRMTGNCTASEGRCVPGAASDCAASDLCKKSGRCTVGVAHARAACVRASK